MSFSQATYQGSYRDTSLAELLTRLLLGRETGNLAIHGPKSKLVIVLNKGVTLSATGDGVRDGLSSYLVEAGILQQQLVYQALEKGGATDTGLMNQLVAMGVINPKTVDTIRAAHARRLIGVAFSWPAATWGFYKGAPKPVDADPINTLDGLEAIAEGVRLYVPEAVLEVFYQNTHHKTLERGEKAPFHPGRLRLNDDEKKIARQFASGRTLDALLTALTPMGVPRMAILRVGYLLVNTQLLELSDRVPGLPSADDIEHWDEEETKAEELKADNPELDKVLQRVAKANMLEVLGVEESDTDEQVKAKYFQLAKDFHPDSAMPGETANDRKARERIFQIIGDAWKNLDTAQKRLEYREAIEAGLTAVDVTNILESEALAVRGKTFLKMGNLAKATECFEGVMKGNPDPETRIYYHYIRYLNQPNDEAVTESVIQAIDQNLKENPAAAVGYQFLGFIYRNRGDLANAEKYFQTCLRTDKNNFEAQRELRMIEKRRQEPDKQPKPEAGAKELFSRLFSKVRQGVKKSDSSPGGDEKPGDGA
ncbi:MAG: hypothetical protein GMKNLPBB_03372 [Myxococcota bacterium]|nr:hypothetical protein [Myxococcota bacterium]